MKTRLTFFTISGDTFFTDFIPYLQDEYEVKIFNRGEKEEFYQMLHDTDVAWFEWGNELIAQHSKAPKMCKYIVRLHSYEMFTPYPAVIDWSKIDKLIFVSDVVKQICIQKFNIPKRIITLIPNGINIDKFIIPKNKKYNKKVAYVGNLNYKKGPMLLLQAFKAIYDYDPNFEFYIAGKHQDERINLYFQGIIKRLPFKIHYTSWTDNVAEYLKDKDYIISTSLFESFQYSVAEGMASGCIPLIHAWLGADKIYPDDHVFFDTKECVDIIRKFENAKQKNKIRQNMREWIADRYSFEKQLKSIKEIIKEVEEM